MTQKIYILDYENSAVTVKLLPKKLHNTQIEEVEEWLSETLGYSLDNIHFMYGANIAYSEEIVNTDIN